MFFPHSLYLECYYQQNSQCVSEHKARTDISVFLDQFSFLCLLLSLFLGTKMEQMFLKILFDYRNQVLVS